MSTRKCPCCDCYTMPEEEGSYDVCPVCFWEDDKSQNDDPEMADGANKVCLNEARENYIKHGACIEELIPFVREPSEYEKTGILCDVDDDSTFD